VPVNRLLYTCTTGSSGFGRTHRPRHSAPGVNIVVNAGMFRSLVRDADYVIVRIPNWVGEGEGVSDMMP
jgi:hypothetical protein